MADPSKTSDLSDVQKDVEQLRADLAALGKDVRKLARDSAGRRAASTLEDLQDSAEHAFASVAEQGRDAARSIEGTVKTRPVESLLVAFGVGVLLGNLIRR